MTETAHAEAGRRETEVPILAVEGAGKSYDGSWAIKDVDFAVHPGEIHALVGENGAGKSTLSKAIAGSIPLTAGRIFVDGRPQQFKAPFDALRQGIAIVYQETSLVPTLTVAQNVQLGMEKSLFTKRAAMIAAVQVFQSIGFQLDPLARVGSLSAAQKQMVEIARALAWQSRVIIFDEPTTTLTSEEKLHLFSLFAQLKRKGVAIIFISHALEEVLQHSDTVTVLRDGLRVHRAPASTLSRADLVQHMVGRTVDLDTTPGTRASRTAPREKVLSVENVTMGEVVKGMSFSLYAGEVTVLAGLVGAGRTEVAKIIAGALKRRFLRGGRIYLRGKSIRYRSPLQAIRDGIVYVTEDRRSEGFFETMSIERNLYLGWLTVRGWATFLLSRRQSAQLAEDWIGRLKVRTPGRSAPIKHLSGGNQQKIIFARAMLQDPSVVIFDEPTKGVDVGSAEDIHRTITELAARGVAVLVISSYLPEVFRVADRILVARAGRIVAEMEPATASAADVMFAATY
jgi:ABC-type sugar transport system ATPase subunit